MDFNERKRIYLKKLKSNNNILVYIIDNISNSNDLDIITDPKSELELNFAETYYDLYSDSFKLSNYAKENTIDIDYSIIDTFINYIYEVDNDKEVIATNKLEINYTSLYINSIFNNAKDYIFDKVCKKFKCNKYIFIDCIILYFKIKKISKNIKSINKIDLNEKELELTKEYSNKFHDICERSISNAKPNNSKIK